MKTTQHIEQIAISKIRVVNPRFRNKVTFRSIINNIADVGLKKPITVRMRRPGKDGTCYDLVCGQGRLEAIAALGGADVPALITEAKRKDCYLMSLVENIARRRPNGSELLQEVRRLKEAGCNNATIGERLGLGHTYIDGIVRLLKCEEAQLVNHVEAGTIPLSIAVKIATAGGKEVQRALNEAYNKGDLRGAKLRVVERLIATRFSRASTKTNAALSGPDLLKEYESFTEKQRALVKRASIVRERLAILTTSLRQLFGDPEFVRLTLEQGFDTMPEHLMSRINRETLGPA
jgi:ParB family chromosome partitioning protein